MYSCETVLIIPPSLHFTLRRVEGWFLYDDVRAVGGMDEKRSMHTSDKIRHRMDLSHKN